MIIWIFDRDRIDVHSDQLQILVKFGQIKSSAARTAAEFVLRKDYRDHWAPELLEEYTYCSQANFEQLFKIHDLRIVVAQPLWNPWIVANRFEGKFYLSDPDDKPVHFPPTNFLIVGEKIEETEGYQILECSSSDQ